MSLAWRKEFPHLAVIAAMFAVAAVLWPMAPDRIPVHWNVAGDVDRFGGKVEGLLAIPILSLAMYLLLLFIPLVDAKRTAAPEFQAKYIWIRLALTGFLVLIDGLILAAAFDFEVDMTRSISFAVGALMILIGLLTSGMPPNGIAGVRTPWTLSSPVAWEKTHRQAKWVFAAIGASFFLLGWLKSGWAMAVVLVVTLGGILGLVAYSYVAWRNATRAAGPQ